MSESTSGCEASASDEHVSSELVADEVDEIVGKEMAQQLQQQQHLHDGTVIIDEGVSKFDAIPFIESSDLKAKPLIQVLPKNL